MEFTFEVRFDYICLFAKDPAENATVALIPDIRPLPPLRPGENPRSPVAALQVGAHFPMVRWRPEQKRDSPDEFPSARRARRKTDRAASVSFHGDDLRGEEILIRVNGKALTEPGPSLTESRLAGLTRLSEGALSSTSLDLDPGYLDTIPATKAPVLEPEEKIALAARLRLHGGNLFTDTLTRHRFVLLKDDSARTPVSTPKRIAQQVQWRIPISVASKEEAHVDILFKPFNETTPTSSLRLGPVADQDTVTLWLRNCDIETDFNIGDPQPYTPMSDNFEPAVYQTLTAGYRGFSHIERRIHTTIPLSTHGVCAPHQLP